MGLKLDKEQWYEQVTKSAATSRERKESTSAKQENRPCSSQDIKVRHNEQGTCLLRQCKLKR
jgi:hypothetical protein